MKSRTQAYMKKSSKVSPICKRKPSSKGKKGKSKVKSRVKTSNVKQTRVARSPPAQKKKVTKKRNVLSGKKKKIINKGGSGAESQCSGAEPQFKILMFYNTIVNVVIAARKNTKVDEKIQNLKVQLDKDFFKNEFLQFTPKTLSGISANDLKYLLNICTSIIQVTNIYKTEDSAIGNVLKLVWKRVNRYRYLLDPNEDLSDSDAGSGSESESGNDSDSDTSYSESVNNNDNGHDDIINDLFNDLDDVENAQEDH